MYKLDRTAFKIQTFEEADNDRNYWLSKTPWERLLAAWFLSCTAYGLDPEKPQKLDRTAFSIRKR